MELGGGSQAKENKNRRSSEFYNEVLISKPLITQAFDVKIENVVMLDSNGVQVNIVNKGDRYSIEYKVVINTNDVVTCLSTGIAITDVMGVMIGTSRDYIEPLDAVFNMGSKVAITRAFTIDLIDGNPYIVKLDVMGKILEKEELLYSVTNALIFEVKKEKRADVSRLGGLVDLKQNVRMVVLS